MVPPARLASAGALFGTDWLFDTQAQCMSPRRSPAFAGRLGGRVDASVPRNRGRQSRRDACGRRAVPLDTATARPRVAMARRSPVTAGATRRSRSSPRQPLSTRTLARPVRQCGSTRHSWHLGSTETGAVEPVDLRLGVVDPDGALGERARRRRSYQPRDRHSAVRVAAHRRTPHLARLSQDRMRQPLTTRCRDHPTPRDVMDDYPIQYGVRSLRRRLLQIASGGRPMVRPASKTSSWSVTSHLCGSGLVPKSALVSRSTVSGARAIEAAIA